MTTWPKSRLGLLLAKLERQHGKLTPPKLDGPFQMILWEIVAYLADDSQRALAFEALRTRVGLTPKELLRAPLNVLHEVTRMGGSIAAGERAERLKTTARLGIGEDRKSYAATYKSVREVTLEELPADSKTLMQAHLLLRKHGQEVCLRNAPICTACAVSSDCRYFQSGR